MDDSSETKYALMVKTNGAAGAMAYFAIEAVLFGVYTVLAAFLTLGFCRGADTTFICRVWLNLYLNVDISRSGQGIPAVGNHTFYRHATEWSQSRKQPSVFGRL
ncbi:hypothetical protein PsYK624_042710 [Phanerochaete sordida]|uniref:Uncharacterized protein n=1 Tax=Phanerochaete sordida TaxID=48140 RepID=A0A9P3G339_9APHY|nr:hypothetical protein PsYK624_042710 [Phanerochaete sordida]